MSLEGLADAGDIIRRQDYPGVCWRPDWLRGAPQSGNPWVLPMDRCALHHALFSRVGLRLKDLHLYHYLGDASIHSELSSLLLYLVEKLKGIY